MYPYVLIVLYLIAATVSAAPAPQQTRPEDAQISPNQVNLGPEISFLPFEPLNAASGPGAPITLNFSSTRYDIRFTDYSLPYLPPAQNFPAALVLIQRYVKDLTFSPDLEKSVQSPVTLPIETTTADGVRFQFKSLTEEHLTYNTFTDLLANIAYFMLTWRKEAVSFELLDRGAGGNPAFSGSITSTASSDGNY